MKQVTNKNKMKLTTSHRLRLTLKQVAWICSGFMLILSIGFMIFFNTTNPGKSFGATPVQFRSNVVSGNWNVATTWQKLSGGTWVTTALPPAVTDGVITIMPGQTVIMNTVVTADEIVISPGGKLIVNGTLNLSNGTGTDLDVSGTLQNSGTIASAASATILMQSTAIYKHMYTNTAGIIPAATWTSGSTCEIDGYLNNNSTPAGLTQAFSNFTWNSPSQTAPIDLNATLNSVTGNLNIVSTGFSYISLGKINGSTNVGGNVNISGGTFVMGDQSNQTYTLNVAGAFNQTGGIYTMMTGSSGIGAMNVSGNFNMVNGLLTAASGSSGTSTINVSGNYSHTGGIITVGGNSATNAQINFSKSGIQTFTASGNTVLGNVDFTIKNGATVDFGNSILVGRNFTVAAGGGIATSNTNSLTATALMGNIMVTGTSTYNSGANYTFNGTSQQTIYPGFPASVQNITINNPTGVVLATNVSITGSLTFITGKIYTQSNELYISNTSPTAITGYNTTSYIVGNLRRAVLGTGTYIYPLGNIIYDEPMSLTLAGVTGVNNILGSFINVDPQDPAKPISGIMIDGVAMTDLFDYGYWRLRPNSPLTAGNYTLTTTEKGSLWQPVASTVWTLLSRPDSTVMWNSVGTNISSTQTVTSAAITAVRSTLTTFGDFGIGFGEFPVFIGSSLKSGTAGQINAVYLFPNVMRGIDAWVQIMDIQGGATLNNIDDQSTGYSACFQPFINYAANTDGYFEWKIMFKKAGTPTDTIIKKITATGVDVDGSNSSGLSIREYIEATMPTSYSLDAATTLTVSNNAGRYKALGSNVTIASIDTSAKQAMYEMYYNNIGSIYYKTGAVNTMASTQIRQTSLYFKAFNLSIRNIALPVKLIYFDSKLSEEQVNLSWATASEINNDFFTVERSSDGINFEKVLMKHGAGNSTSQKNYSDIDPNPLPGYSYYRLKQTDYDGHYTYSDIQTIKNKGANSVGEVVEIKSVAPNPFTTEFDLNFISKEKGIAQIMLMNSTGAVIKDQSTEITEGYNTFQFNDVSDLPQGVYYVTIIFKETKVTKKLLKS